jgi:CelD/BcsL family acetyltransferase involved in cellulose biosynthesis
MSVRILDAAVITRRDWDIVKVGDLAEVAARLNQSVDPVTSAGLPRGNALLLPLAAIATPWRLLAERAIEPNGYYLPDWELAVNEFARGRAGARALTVWGGAEGADPGTDHAIALLPVVSAWDAYRIPLPALVSADPYGTLGTPPIDRECTTEAITRLIAQARAAGARALILRNMSLGGPAMQAFTNVLAGDGVAPRILHAHVRASLDATRDGDELLRDALGPKRIKELRRQRSRLSEHGEVTFNVARTPQDVAVALEVFLALEASGWKARRGTAMRQDAGDAAFIRRAAPALAGNRQCEIVTLRAGDTAVAAAVVLRHLDRAFYFKLGIDEAFSRLSPGVQLTLDLTRHLCADPDINSADSTAAANHPMIDRIWRQRLAIGDVLIPLRPRDPAVALIHAVLATRQSLREVLRRGLHAFRNVREKFR